MSYANSEILPAVAGFFRPLVGRDPYNKKHVDDHQKAAYKAISVLEQHLLVNTFLVGERITLADIFAVSIVSRGFEYLFDKEWRKENPNVTRWFETIHNQPYYIAITAQVPFIDEALKNQAPVKKDQAPKKEKEPAPKAAPKPKAKEAEEDEEEEQPVPKAKHPLEVLPKPTLALDDWKRKYSNEDTREVALPWFWENFKADEYSIWRLDYKYNSELTMTFMTSNLIGTLILQVHVSQCLYAMVICPRVSVLSLLKEFFAFAFEVLKYLDCNTFIYSLLFIHVTVFPRPFPPISYSNLSILSITNFCIN